MQNEVYQQIIENYIEAYNRFDVTQMLADMDDNIRFENISNGETNLVTQGIAELKTQAEQATKLFSQRKQTITGFVFRENEAEIGIDYAGVLAQDIPNGPKAGEEIRLSGKSVFRFSGNKIVELKDIS